MYRRLLVPVDGSELSSRAMEEGLRLARQLGAAVTGFVAEPQVALPGTLVIDPEPYDRATEHERRVAAHAGRLLERFEALARAAGVGFEGHFTLTHDIDAAIAQAALDKGCDMIVMVTHGRGAFSELLFGSHTKGVLGRSKLPVLVLH